MGYTSDFFKKKLEESETITQPTESFGAGSFVFDPSQQKWNEQFSSIPDAKPPRSEAPKYDPGIPNALPFDKAPEKQFIDQAVSEMNSEKEASRKKVREYLQNGDPELLVKLNDSEKAAVAYEVSKNDPKNESFLDDVATAEDVGDEIFFSTTAKGIGMLNSLGGKYGSDWLKKRMETTAALSDIRGMIKRGEFVGEYDKNSLSLLDKDFWIQEIAPTIIGNAPMMAAAIASWGAVAAAWAGTIATIGANVGIGLSMSAWDSLSEGGSVLFDLKSKGVDDETAMREATDVSKANMLKTVTDVGQMLYTFSPIKGMKILPGQLGTKVAKAAGWAGAKIWINMATEAIEEGPFQGWISHYNTQQGLGKDPGSYIQYLESDENAKAMVVGGLVGGIFGWAGAGIDIVQKQISDIETRTAEVNKHIADPFFREKLQVIVDGTDGLMTQEYADSLVEFRDNLAADRGIEINSIADAVTEKAQAVATRLQEFQSNYQQDVAAKYGKETLGGEPESIASEMASASKLSPVGFRVKVEESVTDENGKDVRGKTDLKEKTITLSKKFAKETTAMHEAAHAYLSIQDEQAKKRIFDEVRDQYGKDLTNDQAEEYFAEELKYYRDEKKFQDTAPLGWVREKIKDASNLLSRKLGKGSEVRYAYNSIMRGGRKYTPKTSIGMQTASKFQEVFSESDSAEIKEDFFKQISERAKDPEDSVSKVIEKAKTDIEVRFSSGPLANRMKLGKIYGTNSTSHTKVAEVIDLIEKGNFRAVLANKEYRSIADSIFESTIGSKIFDNYKTQIEVDKEAKIKEEADREQKRQDEMLDKILESKPEKAPEAKPAENQKTEVQMMEELKAKRAELGATKANQALVNWKIVTVTKTGKISTAKKVVGKRTQEEIDQANARKALVEKVSQDLIKIAKNINEPKPEDFQRIFEENAEDVIRDSVKYAIKIGAMTEEDARKFADFANVTIPKYVNKSGEGMNKAQETAATDMEGWYAKVFKDAKEYKISIKALSGWVKKTGIRLHLVETPEAKRVPIPFTLMGNKSATIRKIIKPAVINAIKNGSKNYVEPYGGAGTTLYIADDLFSAGLETMDLNFYDKEKYVVQNAVKNGEIDPVKDVEEAWDSVMRDIIDSIKDEPGMQELVEYLPEFGTPAFKEAASLIFYPTYATRYFKEVEDGKLAKGGVLTTTFMEWLVEDVKKNDTTLTDEEAEQVAMEMLDEENFEANYPKISSQISEVIARIDDIDSIQGDARTALRVAIAKHLKQRGSSGQRILSASSGFTSVAGARDKMIKGLSFYKEVYNRHGDKITIHNADGKEFVSDMAGKYDAKNVVMYADPPYIRTTKVYVGNRGVEELGNLVEYGDPKKYKEIFAPMKDATAIFTNDVNGEYFNSLQELYGDRLSKDVLAYREGTTPTSMVTTVETRVTPKEMGLPYYRINKARKIKEAIRNLEETVFPRISKALQKQISKMIVAIEKSADTTRMKLIEEIKKQENAVIQFDQLQSLVELLVTGKEKQNILTKAKKLVRSGTISGPKMLDMFQYINKAWEDRLDMVKQVRDEASEFRNDDNADVRAKKEFEEEYAGYAFRPFTNQQKADIVLLEAINSGEYTAEQSKEYIDRLVNGKMVDTDTGEKVNETEKEYFDGLEAYVGKKSIYDMTIEDAREMYTKISKAHQQARDLLALNETKRDAANILYSKELVESGDIIKVDNPQDIPTPADQKGMALVMSDAKWVISGAKQTAKETVDDFTPMTWLLENAFGLKRLYMDFVLPNFNRHLRYVARNKEEFHAIERKHKINSEGFKRIQLHWLARRWDQNGWPKLIATLSRFGDPITGEKLDSPEEIKVRIAEYSNDSFLSDGELEMYDFMRLKYDENRPKILETQYEEFNKQMQLVENYWPISIDMKESTKDPKIAEIFKDFDLSNGDDLEISKVTNYMAYGTETKHGFTEQTTTLPLIVRLDARSTFLTHMDDASYFANMQQAIKRMNEIVKMIAPQMGTYSERRVREYIGMLARKGMEPAFAKDRNVLTNIFDTTARNLPSAALVGNVSNYFVQLTAVVEMLTTHGIPAADAFKWMSDPKIANFIKENSSLQYREEVDFTRYAKGEWIQNIKNVSKGVKNMGMLPIKVMDQLVGKTVWYSAYLDFKERGFTEEQAILEAELLTKKTIASGHIIDNAMAITRLKNKPGFVWLSVFQTFIANHSFGIIRFAGGDQSKIVRKTSKALGLSKKGTSIMKWGSAMMFMFVAFPALEELIRRLTGRKPRSIGEMSFQTFASMVPYLNSLYGLARFWGPMGEIFTSAENSIKAIMNDKDPSRNITKLAFAMMAALGVPGSIQVGKEVLDATKKETAPAVTSPKKKLLRSRKAPNKPVRRKKPERRKN